jgi:hypothetical protein
MKAGGAVQRLTSRHVASGAASLREAGGAVRRLTSRHFASGAANLLHEAAAIAEELRRLPADCIEIVAEADHVVIDEVALREFSASISAEELQPPPASDTNDVNADSFACLLAWNAVNFSYFPDAHEPRWFCEIGGTIHGQDDEANGVKALIEHHHSKANAFFGDSEWLGNLTMPQLTAIFQPSADAGDLPLLPERLSCFHDLGSGLSTIARAANRPSTEGILGLIELSDKSAVTFCGLLCAAAPCWYDVRQYETSTIETIHASFLKRAQLSAAYLQAVGLTDFEDMHALTVFSDYRVSTGHGWGFGLECACSCKRESEKQYATFKSRLPLHSCRSFSVRQECCS